MLLENIKVCLFLQPLREGMVRCLSGRKERFAKPSYGLNCTEGSNPSLTASFKSLVVFIDSRAFLFVRETAPHHNNPCSTAMRTSDAVLFTLNFVNRLFLWLSTVSGLINSSPAIW